jgi:hypothetical protein
LLSPRIRKVLENSNYVISPNLYSRQKKWLNRYYKKPFRLDVAKRFLKKPFPKKKDKKEVKLTPALRIA